MAGGVHVHDLIPFGTSDFDTSHEIYKLAFGEEYPGMENPLDGLVIPKVNSQNKEGVTGAYQYFLKVTAVSFVIDRQAWIRSRTLPCNSTSGTSIPGCL